MDEFVDDIPETETTRGTDVFVDEGPGTDVVRGRISTFVDDDSYTNPFLDERPGTDVFTGDDPMSSWKMTRRQMCSWTTVRRRMTFRGRIRFGDGYVRGRRLGDRYVRVPQIGSDVFGDRYVRAGRMGSRTMTQCVRRRQPGDICVRGRRSEDGYGLGTDVLMDDGSGIEAFTEDDPMRSWTTTRGRMCS